MNVQHNTEGMRSTVAVQDVTSERAEILPPVLAVPVSDVGPETVFGLTV
jgi:hypothetical protein